MKIGHAQTYPEKGSGRKCRDFFGNLRASRGDILNVDRTALNVIGGAYWDGSHLIELY